MSNLSLFERSRKLFFPKSTSRGYQNVNTSSIPVDIESTSFGSEEYDLQNRISDKTKQLETKYEIVDILLRELYELRGKLVIVEMIKKYNHPTIKPKVTDLIITLLRIGWIGFSLYALIMSPQDGIFAASSQLMCVMFILDFISLFDLDYWVPRSIASEITQMNFSYSYLIFRLVSNDIIGFAATLMLSDLTHNHGFAISPIATSYYLCYTLFFAFRLLYGTVQREYPNLLYNFSFSTYAMTFGICRLFGRGGLLPFQYYWDFQIAVVESRYTGRCSNILFLDSEEDSMIFGHNNNNNNNGTTESRGKKVDRYGDATKRRSSLTVDVKGNRMDSINTCSTDAMSTGRSVGFDSTTDSPLKAQLDNNVRSVYSSPGQQQSTTLSTLSTTLSTTGQQEDDEVVIAYERGGASATKTTTHDEILITSDSSSILTGGAHETMSTVYFDKESV